MAQQIVVELATRTPHPLYKISLSREHSTDAVVSSHRFAELSLFYNSISAEITKKKIPLPKFPVRYSKQNFGFVLNSAELLERVKALQLWFSEFIKVIDTKFSMDAQLLFKGLLGGRVGTMVSRQSVDASNEEEAAEDGGVADGEVTAQVRTVWEQQNIGLHDKGMANIMEAYHETAVLLFHNATTQKDTIFNGSTQVQEFYRNFLKHSGKGTFNFHQTELSVDGQVAFRSWECGSNYTCGTDTSCFDPASTKICFHMFSARVAETAGDIFADYASAVTINTNNASHKVNDAYSSLFASRNIPEIVKLFHEEASITAFDAISGGLMTYNGSEGIKTGFEVFYSSIHANNEGMKKSSKSTFSEDIKLVSEHVYETANLGGVVFRVWASPNYGVEEVSETIHFNKEGQITHHISTISKIQVTIGNSDIVFCYWPLQGRGLGISLMLEDSGVKFDRQIHDGSPIDGTVVAVPAVKLDGEWLSQSLVCMLALGDDLGFAQASKDFKAKPLQALHNLFDVQEESFKKRAAMKTVAEAEEFLSTRASQFFRAVEHMYKEFGGVYYLGDKPSVVDFQLVSCLTIFNYAFGDKIVEKAIREAAPTCYAAYLAMIDRPRIKSYIEGGYGGFPIYTPSAKMSAEYLTRRTEL